MGSTERMFEARGVKRRVHIGGHIILADIPKPLKKREVDDLKFGLS
jgi:hypothetical protein